MPGKKLKLLRFDCGGVRGLSSLDALLSVPSSVTLEEEEEICEPCDYFDITMSPQLQYVER